MITVDGSSSDTIDGVLYQQILKDDCLMISDYATGKWAIL